MVNCLLTLSPHRDTHITYDTCAVLLTFLTADSSQLLYVQAIGLNWLGTPSTLEHWRLAVDPTLREHHPTQPYNAALAKQAMWTRLATDYTPSNKPSHIACHPPDGNKPTPAIHTAVGTQSWLVTSTIFHLATNRCFDTDHSDRFCPMAGDITICPCAS